MRGLTHHRIFALATLVSGGVLLGNCGGTAARSSSAASTSSTSSSTSTTSTDPALGMHVLKAEDESLGASPTTTPTGQTSQASGNTFVVVTMGWKDNYATPTDTYSNTWTSLNGRNLYAGGNFYTAVWTAVNGRGGSNHQASVTKTSHATGEISFEFLEIKNANTVQDYKYAYPGSAQPLTPGSVTTTGPAVLIAIWSGDGWDLTHTASPDNGFTVIDSYLVLGPTSAVQIAIASKTVTQAGTYTVNWTHTPAQGAALYLLAIQK